MSQFSDLSKQELLDIQQQLLAEYGKIKEHALNLDMSRGKPSSEQLDLSNELLTLDVENYITEKGIDARNYGELTGLEEMKRLFSDLLDIDTKNIIIGGNSSLNLFYDSFVRLYIFGSLGSTPWGKLDKCKVLCPTPGYDRHFAICEELGFEMICIPMTPTGPDMDMVESLVKADESIKAIICVPLYSNPDGICYSDETVDRLAKMETAAKDFKIFWDNAYGIHHVYEETKLMNIFEACGKYGTEDRILYFFSTSKVNFPGAGVSMVAASDACIKEIAQRLSKQTISYNKLTQLQTVNFFRTADSVIEHMKKLAETMKPKFDIVLSTLSKEFDGTGLLTWQNARGGYFVSVHTIEGCAKETVRLAKEVGLILTDAGAAFPYGIDPKDTNIRIAPSFPTNADLQKAIDVFCLCVKLASVNKLLESK